MGKLGICVVAPSRDWCCLDIIRVAVLGCHPELSKFCLIDLLQDGNLLELFPFVFFRAFNGSSVQTPVALDCQVHSCTPCMQRLFHQMLLRGIVINFGIANVLKVG